MEIVPVAYPVDSHEAPMMHSMMGFYNVTGGPYDGEHPRNINIPEYEGSQDIAKPKMLIDRVNQPLKIQTVNIETKEEPKFANIGDYWNEETMVNIIDLLHEF